MQRPSSLEKAVMMGKMKEKRTISSKADRLSYNSDGYIIRRPERPDYGQIVMEEIYLPAC